MGDICHPTEGRLLSHVEISTKFSVACTLLKALSVRLQIPLYWREALSRDWKPPPLQWTGPDISVSFREGFPLELSSLSAKDMYNNFLQKDQQINAAYNKWTAGEDGISIDSPQEWNEVCTRAFSSSRETKLQSLQYKIYNRIAPCGVHLKQIRIRDTNDCPFCQEKDTTIHFFFHCEKVSSFWRKVCKWFTGATNLYLNRLTPKEFLFGVPKEFYRSKIINFTLMHLHFHIFRQKLFHESKLCLLQWLKEFSLSLQVEKWICARSGKKASFNKWTGILAELG